MHNHLTPTGPARRSTPDHQDVVAAAEGKLAELQIAVRTGQLNRHQAGLVNRALDVYRSECTDPLVLLLAVNGADGGGHR